MKFAEPDNPRPVILDFGSARGHTAILNNLSGVAVDDGWLWTVSDEERTVERLRASADGYRLAEQIKLDDLLPDLPPGKEADLERIDVANGRVWVCGSHCRVRHQPDADGRMNAGFRRRPSRHVLAAFPPDRPEDCVALPYLGDGSLRRRLRSDPFLSAFMNLPSKENGLDIEGLAVGPGWLKLGLRGPVVDSFAVVMELALGNSGRLASWLMRIVSPSGWSTGKRRAICSGLQAVAHRRSCRGPWRRPLHVTAGPGTAVPFGVTTEPASRSCT